MRSQIKLKSISDVDISKLPDCIKWNEVRGVIWGYLKLVDGSSVTVSIGSRADVYAYSGRIADGDHLVVMFDHDVVHGVCEFAHEGSIIHLWNRCVTMKRRQLKNYLLHKNGTVK